MIQNLVQQDRGFGRQSLGCRRRQAGSYLFCVREAFLDIRGFDEEYYAAEEIWFSRALKKWGKVRGMKMIILNESVETSLRKVEWFTSWQLFKQMAPFGLNPFRLKKRDACTFWYKRPEPKDETSEVANQ